MDRCRGATRPRFVEPSSQKRHGIRARRLLSQSGLAGQSFDRLAPPLPLPDGGDVMHFANYLVLGLLIACILGDSLATQLLMVLLLGGAHTVAADVGIDD